MKGEFIEPALEMDQREDVLLWFATSLSYENLNSLDVFNTFQGQARSMFEKIGFNTIATSELSRYQNPVIMSTSMRGLIKLYLFDNFVIHQQIFEKFVAPQIQPTDKFVPAIIR